MLKFTAELSDQFRRASSLSTLQAYHQSKSAIKSHQKHNNWVTTDHQSIEHLKKMMGPSHMHKSHIYNKKNINQYQSHQNYKNYTSTKPIKTVGNYPTFCDMKNYTTCPSREVHEKSFVNINKNYNNPVKKVSFKGIQKETNTYSTNNTKNYQLNNQNKDSMFIRVLQPAKSLNRLNNQQVKITQIPFNKQKQMPTKKYQNYYTQDFNGQHTFRSTKTKQNANPSTKMRISSINTLQNIQKRIQSTLNQQRTLKI